MVEPKNSWNLSKQNYVKLLNYKLILTPCFQSFSNSSPFVHSLFSTTDCTVVKVYWVLKTVECKALPLTYDTIIFWIFLNPGWLRTVLIVYKNL